jgi:predicted phosphate transport protein (TIGR00153 family)
MPTMDLKRVDRVFRILPKEERYYELLDRLVETVLDGCLLLCEFFEPGAEQAVLVGKLKSVERRGDEVALEILNRLQKSFVTPIDREDIHDLARTLDKILDDAFGAASFAEASGLGEADEHLRQLAHALVECVRHLDAAIEKLNDRDGISEHCTAFHRLEDEADARYNAAIRSLFSGSPDPLRVLRLKELYERLEDATDRSHHAAAILESIVFKNS